MLELKSFAWVAIDLSMLSLIVINQHLPWDSIHRKSIGCFMEWLLLIESVTIFSSQHISIEVRFRFPWSSIELCHACNESTCYNLTLASLRHSQHIVKICFVIRQSLSIRRLDSESWLSVGVSWVGGPGSTSTLDVLAWMSLGNGLFTMLMANRMQSAVLLRRYTCEIKTVNITQLMYILPSSTRDERSIVKSITSETPPGQCCESASEFIVRDLTRDIASIPRNRIVLILFRRLYTTVNILYNNVVVDSDEHIIDCMM